MWKKRDSIPEPVERPLANQPPTHPPLEVSSMTTTPRILETTAGAARLGSGLRLKGEITGDEDLQIDGSLEGTVHLAERKVTIGPGAQVNADIVAREVIVYGQVRGNLHGRERIEIRKDGSVVGDLTTARIVIEDGAYFKGSIEIERPESPAANRERETPRS